MYKEGRPHPPIPPIQWGLGPGSPVQALVMRSRIWLKGHGRRGRRPRGWVAMPMAGA